MEQSGSTLGMFFPLILFVVIFYFFILRPQKKRQKSHDNLIASLTRGDRIITAGGFFGIVREVKEDSVIIEIAEGTKARILKSSISTKVGGDSAAPAQKEAKEAKEAKDDAKEQKETESE